MSRALAGSLCGVSWEPWFLGWLGLLYSGTQQLALVEVWHGLCIFLSHAFKKTLDSSCGGDY